MSSTRDILNGRLIDEIHTADDEPPIPDEFRELDVIDDNTTGDPITVFFDDQHIDEQEGLYIRDIGGLTVDLQEVR